MAEPDMSQPPRVVMSGRGLSWDAIVEVGCLVLMTAVGLAAWLLGIYSKGYDYDEVLRAHSIWLTTQGLRPYSDFFEVHPPYFVLLSPLMRAFVNPVEGLKALRLLSGLGNLCFLRGMVALGIMSLPQGAGRRWAWLGIAFVCFNPLILDDLVEFRVDGWGYAAIVWATVRFCRGNRGLRRTFEFAASTAIASALFAPKLVFLPPFIALFDIILGFTTWRGFVREGVSYVAGVAFAATLFLAYLFANRIGLDRTILLLGRYHAVSNTHAGFGRGLFERILTMKLLFLLTVGGISCWGFTCLRRRTVSGPFEPAVAIWLVMQAVLVTYPYKQYYAPWFLFASAFVPSIGTVFDRILGRARGVVFVVACVTSVFGSSQIARFWVVSGSSLADHKRIDWMNKVSSPVDRVVGSPPYHPIARFDSFFLSFNTTDPGGFDSERIIGELPALRPFVAADHYRGELEAHPPAVVVLRSPYFEVRYPSTQRRVLEDFVLREGYRTVRFAGVWFALRPDRFEHARLNGYLE